MEKPGLRFTTSWDDGIRLDLKIARILRDAAVPGTFYVPSVTELSKDDIRRLGRDFAIGGHTVEHPEDLKRLDDDGLDYEVRVNKEHLEDCLGRPVTSFAYPSGRYDERVIGFLKKAGFKEARTTIVLKTQARDPFRIDTTIHTRPRPEYAGRQWDEIGWDYAVMAAETGGYFHLWGHALDLEIFSYWDRLRAFLERINSSFTVKPV